MALEVDRVTEVTNEESNMPKPRGTMRAVRAKGMSLAVTSNDGMPNERWVLVGGQRLEIKPGDTFEWQVRLKLPSLAKLYIRPKYKEPWRRDLGGKKPPRRGFLDEVGGYGTGPKLAQQRALSYLADNEAAVYGKVLRALADYANELRSGGGWDDFDDPPGINAVMPRKMTPDQAAERIQITHVGVTTKARNAMAYLEIAGECAWDPDHGFEVVLHGDRLVGVYQQGTGWVDKRPRKGTATKRMKPY
jgi:hypothetical protein